MVQLIEKNILLCGFAERSTVLQKDLAEGIAFLTPKQESVGFDLVFLDPPYGTPLAMRVLESLASGNFLDAKGVVVLEDAAGAQYPQALGSLVCFDQRRYGEAGFWLYRHMEAECND